MLPDDSVSPSPLPRTLALITGTFNALQYSLTVALLQRLHIISSGASSRWGSG
jgi:hypothetical protein